MTIRNSWMNFCKHEKVEENIYLKIGTNLLKQIILISILSVLTTTYNINILDFIKNLQNND